MAGPHGRRPVPNASPPEAAGGLCLPSGEERRSLERKDGRKTPEEMMAEQELHQILASRHVGRTVGRGDGDGAVCYTNDRPGAIV